MDWKELKKGNWVKFWYPEQPRAASMEEWDEFDKYQRRRPFAYFMAETMPDFFRYKLIWPVKRLKDKIEDVLFMQPVIKIRSLPPGYHEFDTKMLHASFQMLVDYVEIECANMQAWCHSECKRPPRFWRKMTDWRNPQWGIEYLAWCTTLDQPGMSEHERSPAQAAKGRETLALYNWWKFARPRRDDPLEISGWTGYCKEREDTGVSIFSRGSDADRARSRNMLEIMNKLEEKYYNEDTEMLTRLVKLRQDIWT